ncbi:MAG: SagB/ThcOx family dehydrogenase [Candidatus Bipolaricaulia bacterium]
MEKIGGEFMEKTRYRHLEPSAQERGLTQPPLQVALAEESERIGLPKLDGISLGEIELRAAIEARRSLREYAEIPLRLEELSFLLWCTQGVRDHVSERATFRTVPSAGARHPFETVILANRVDGLEPALYQYLALDHCLIGIPSSHGAAERLTAACLGQGMISTSAATFVWIADSVRMTWRYGERGYRYLHLDAGHVCQNLYLASEAIHGGTCAIGAFDDDQVNDLLGLDGRERFAVYLATVGKRAPRG